MNTESKYLYLAIGIFFVTAYFSVGHLHPDEYYQILEFAAYKLHLNSPHGLTWEFYAQIRPTIQAWMVVYLYKLTVLFGTANPFFVAFLTRLFAGLLSIISILLFIDTFKSELNTPYKQKWFILLSLFTWLIVYNGIRYSSENISAKLFLIGFCLLFWPKLRRNYLSYLLIGVLLGLSFVVRYQVGFMILGIMGWLLLIKRLNFKNWLIICLGIGIAISFGMLLDYRFYGDFIFTPWRYFAANILQGKAATFSVDPWYSYLAIAGLLPYGPLYVLGSILFILTKPKHVISWIMLPFIIAHVLVAHKELRFLTPLLNFMPFVIIASIQTLEERYDWKFSTKAVKLNYIAWIFNCFLLAVAMLVPSTPQIGVNIFMYKHYRHPTAFNYLTEGGNILDFYKHLNLRPVPIQNPNQLDCKAKENCLLALTCQETKKFGAPNGKLVFSDCPPWIFKLDFNNWLERTALYNIYDLSSIEPKTNK